MRCKSSSTDNPESYQAGCELGEALAEIEPEAVVLFSSIRHDLDDLFEGLRDAFDDRPVEFIGGTGAGVYGSAGMLAFGASALGLSGGGAVSVTTAVQAGADVDAFAAGRACAQTLIDRAPGPIHFALAFTDLSVDGAAAVDGIQAALAAPIAGGLTGDDATFERGYVFAGGGYHRHAVALLGFSGELAFAVNSASGWTPAGATGVIEAAQGAVVERISGQTALDFVSAQLDSPTPIVDIGDIPLAAYVGDDEHFLLRSPARLEPRAGSIRYLGNIPIGTRVRVCWATPEQVLAGVDQALAGLDPLGFTPSGVVLMSCAGRQALLGGVMEEEVARVKARLGPELPLVGMPSYGEIGPFRGPDGRHTGSYFHNVSIVCVALGAPPCAPRF